MSSCNSVANNQYQLGVDFIASLSRPLDPELTPPTSSQRCTNMVSGVQAAAGPARRQDELQDPSFGLQLLDSAIVGIDQNIQSFLWLRK